MHFLSTPVQNCLLLTQLPDCCVSFQIVLFFESLHLTYCVCLMSMVNKIFNYIQFQQGINNMQCIVDGSVNQNGSELILERICRYE